MNVTTERLDNCQVNVIIEMDAAEIDQKLRETARRISRKFNVPGYRRGKAPFQAVVRVFGREAIQEETIDEFGQQWYEEALEQIDYKPYEPGALKEVEWEPFRMTVLLPIMPEVELGDYRSVRVPFEPEPVTDDMIDAYLQEIQEQNAEWVPVERPAAMGDQVVVDAVGKIGDDEEVFDQEGLEVVLEVGARQPIPGFHEEIVGMVPGGDKSFDLAYPEDDPRTELAGQEASFTVHLQTVKEKDTPPIDDDLALMVGDYDTLDDLKASIRERLEAQAVEVAESAYLDKALEVMIEAADKIEYPPQAVDREAEAALDRMERNLGSSGIDLDQYLAMIGKTRDVYKGELRPAAETRLRKRLVLHEVAAKEGLDATEEEIHAEIDRVSAAMGDQADEMREMLSSPAGHLTIEEDIVMEKAQERIVAIAKGEAPALEPAGAEAGTEGALEVQGEAEPGEMESGEAQGEPVPAMDVEPVPATAAKPASATEAETAAPEEAGDDQEPSGDEPIAPEA